jgi:uncharacterized protein
VPEAISSPRLDPLRIGITHKVQFLSQSRSYPEQPTRIEVIETHFSWVFLTERHAYKLKKPVMGVGFDLRSIEARRRNALTELRLNRRLANDVYVGVLPLSLRKDGSLALGGSGSPVDWVVKMVRLDAGRMLETRLIHGNWHFAELEVLACRLARFFATARAVRLSAPEAIARLRSELRASLTAFAAADEPGLLRSAQLIRSRLDAYLSRRARLFHRRIRHQHMVDGHGDLRPEHIYLNGTPRIIDCLEFCAELRQLDPVNELAFLALECRRLGAPPISELLFRRYRERTGDKPLPELVRFYTALNALIRARIAIQHLADPGSRTRPELIARSGAYLAMARQEIGSLSRRHAPTRSVH